MKNEAKKLGVAAVKSNRKKQLKTQPNRSLIFLQILTKIK